MMVEGKSGMIYIDDTNPVGPLDGGAAGGRVRDVLKAVGEHITWRVEALEAVAGAARAVLCFTDEYPHEPVPGGYLSQIRTALATLDGGGDE